MKIARLLFTAWQLFWDPKVPSILKFLLPVLAFIYWVSPIDFIPFFPLDDIIVVALALKTFVNLAQDPDSDEPHHQSGSSAPDLDDGAINTTWRVVDDE